MVPLVARLLRHWPLKLAALTLSILLWALISAEETTSQLVAVRLDLDVPPALALASPVPQVRALVTGPGRELIKLYADPLSLRAAVPPGVGSHWRLGITPADIEVPNAAAVSIQDVEPRELEIDVDRLIRRTVPVALRGTVAARNGFMLDSLTLSPSSVQVTGARIRVAELDSAPTEAVDLHDVTGAFQRLLVVDTTGYPLLQFAPSQVSLKGHAHRL